MPAGPVVCAAAVRQSAAEAAIQRRFMTDPSGMA
jgi:hypothetical protein